jgi:uncharacterized protein YjbJ (UPF0337 family)
MNWDQVAGEWKQLKGAVKERWGKLTDDDLDVVNGRSEQLVGALQKRYGIAKEAAESQVNDFLTNLKQPATPESVRAEKTRKVG